MSDKALPLARKAGQLFPDEDLITIDLVRTFRKNKLYQDCYSVLKEAEILPYEGQRDTHRLFVECQVYLAMEDMKKGNYAEAIQHLEGSKEYPERLGTGKPHQPDYRLQDYLMSLCYDKMDERDTGEEARKRIYEYTLHHANSRRAGRYYSYFSALIYQHFEEPEKSYALLKDWESPPEGEMIADVIELIEGMNKSKE